MPVWCIREDSVAKIFAKGFPPSAPRNVTSLSASASVCVSSAASNEDLSKKLNFAIEKITNLQKEFNAMKSDRDNLQLKLSLCEAKLMAANFASHESVVKSPKRKVPKSKSVKNMHDISDSDDVAPAEMDNEAEDDLQLPSTSKGGSGGVGAGKSSSVDNVNRVLVAPKLSQPSFQSVKSAAPAKSAKTCRPTAGNSTNSNANANVPIANRTSKKILQVSDSSLFEIRRKLVAANIADFTLKQVRRNGPIKVTLANVQQSVAAKQTLAKAGASFHEFLNSDEKRRCFIIRGIVGATNDDLEFIRQDLIDAGLPDTIEVQLHETGFIKANISTANNIKINQPVKLIVPPNMDVKILNNIKYLNHIVVRFEEFVNKHVVQCKNCQRFGHSAAGCQHEHRCVKCGANHYRSQCPRTRDAAVKLVCCNCGGEHTANNVNVCKFFLQNYAKAGRAAAPMSKAVSNTFATANSTTATSAANKNTGVKNTPATAKIPLVSSSGVGGQLSFSQVLRKTSQQQSTSSAAAAANRVNRQQQQQQQHQQLQQQQQQQRRQQQLSANIVNNSVSKNMFSEYDNLFFKNIDLRFNKIESNIENLSCKLEQLVTIFSHLSENSLSFLNAQNV